VSYLSLILDFERLTVSKSRVHGVFDKGASKAANVPSSVVDRGASEETPAPPANPNLIKGNNTLSYVNANHGISGPRMNLNKTLETTFTTTINIQDATAAYLAKRAQNPNKGSLGHCKDIKPSKLRGRYTKKTAD